MSAAELLWLSLGRGPSLWTPPGGRWRRVAAEGVAGPEPRGPGAKVGVEGDLGRKGRETLRAPAHDPSGGLFVHVDVGLHVPDELVRQ